MFAGGQTVRRRALVVLVVYARFGPGSLKNVTKRTTQSLLGGIVSQYIVIRFRSKINPKHIMEASEIFPPTRWPTWA